MLQCRLGIEDSVPAETGVTNRVRLHWSGGDIDLGPVEIMINPDEKRVILTALFFFQLGQLTQ